MCMTTTLGSTGLTVGRLGLAASYGAPARAFEEAFDQGCNYFYLGGGRRKARMKQAVKNLVEQGHRDKMVIAVQTYARFGMLTPMLFKRALAGMGTDYADVLILGWHNRQPSARLIDVARKMKEKGICRFIALSGHNRSLFPVLAKQKIFDIFHIRYNAAHRGAETETFPLFAPEAKPGIVSYTATRWGHLMNPKKMPDSEAPLSAADCYRFVLANPDIDVCLCGPKNIDEMRTALTALDAPPLSDEQLNRIRMLGDYVRQNSGGLFA